MFSNVIQYYGMYRHLQVCQSLPKWRYSEEECGIYLKPHQHALRMLILNFLADEKHVMVTNSKYSTHHHCNY